MTSGKVTLGKMAGKYRWVAKLLEYRKAQKLLGTYVEGIQGRMKYNVIRPSFLQHGTTSGRYSSKLPNFQNLPREDKRVKSCIIARKGKVFVGADYSQLEPRVFASISQDETLMACFASGEDFYSVIGAPIFGIHGLSLFKDDPNSFAKKYPGLRDRAKVLALATPYGRTAAQQAAAMEISMEESRDLIDRYFTAYPAVEAMMLESHEQAKLYGIVHSLYGRPRRMPQAMGIPKLFGKTAHADLPYDYRNLLNLAMNHRVQSTASSIMNRAAISFWNICHKLSESDSMWADIRLVMQVHDELIVECPEEIAVEVADSLKYAMENTSILPGVALITKPVIANNLGDLK
jgi:DNA polymerase-1